MSGSKVTTSRRVNVIKSFPIKERKQLSCQHIFSVQAWVLDAFGVWSQGPAAAHPCSFTRLRRFLYLFLIIPATFISLFLVSRSISALEKQHSTGKNETMPIIRSLALLPEIVIASRGICVLLFLSIQKVDLQSIVEEIENVIWKSIPSDKLAGRNRKWQLTNQALIIYGICSFIPVCALSVVNTNELTHTNFGGNIEVQPFPGTMPTWLYVLLESVFSWFPYMLSQIIMIMITSCSVIILDCFSAVNEELKKVNAQVELISKIEHCGELETNTEIYIQLDDTTAQLEHLMKVRAWQYHFVEHLNHTLGIVILLSYLVDVTAAGGMLTMLITDAQHTSVSVPTKVIGTFVFVSYATCLYIPMVLATETAEDAPALLYQITIKAYSLIKTQLAKDLGIVLADFRLMTTTFPVHFNAGKLFYVERNFLVTTFSLLCTFALILQEFLGHMDLKTLKEVSENTTALLGALLNNSHAARNSTEIDGGPKAGATASH